MSESLKPIETLYRGYRFRSRLEAKWAVAFDAIGWYWEYETEGMALKSGNYLPDFSVQVQEGVRRWWEIKPGRPARPPDVELDWRWVDLVATTGNALIVAYGLPEPDQAIWDLVTVNRSEDWSQLLVCSRYGVGRGTYALDSVQRDRWNARLRRRQGRQVRAPQQRPDGAAPARGRRAVSGFVVPTCSLCRRERTIHDAYDYNPLQVVTGRPVGWYSGDDGELCPECMTRTLSGETP